MGKRAACAVQTAFRDIRQVGMPIGPTGKIFKIRLKQLAAGDSSNALTAIVPPRARMRGHSTGKDLPMYRSVQLFIDGQWRDSESGKTIDVINPATEEVVGTVAHAERPTSIWRLRPRRRISNLAKTSAAGSLQDNAHCRRSVASENRGGRRFDDLRTRQAVGGVPD